MQPSLPEDVDWPNRTAEWWEAWGNDPRTENCSEVDWLFLMDGAALHAAAWGGGDYQKINDLRAHMTRFDARLRELAEQGQSGETVTSGVPKAQTAVDVLLAMRAERDSKTA